MLDRTALQTALLPKQGIHREVSHIPSLAGMTSGSQSQHGFGGSFAYTLSTIHDAVTNCSSVDRSCIYGLGICQYESSTQLISATWAPGSVWFQPGTVATMRLAGGYASGRGGDKILLPVL
jgi:hypothetical protein